MTARPLTGRPSRAALGAISRTLATLSVLAGIALWLTPATFDLALLPPDRPVRVAMLPPLWQIPVFVLAASLAIAAIARLLPRIGSPTIDATTDAGGDATNDATTDARRHATGDARRDVTRDGPRDGPGDGPRHATREGTGDAMSDAKPADVLLPTAGVALLFLPYLPWLPDALPILRLLAGPGRSLLWFTVAALIARGFWRALPRRARCARAPAHHVALALFVIGTLVYGTAATVFMRTVLYPGGDEPHYLIMAQSLWRDGDLTIQNNHERGDYHEYFENDLRPHYLTRGVDRRIYSVHPVGVAVLLAPVYALGGYRLVVWVLALIAGAAGALAWMLAWRASGSRAAASAAWLACCLNGPWVFNSFAVYPEVPAALAVTGAWLLMSARGTSVGDHVERRSGTESAPGWVAWVACGTAIATLPWLSTKYAPMACAIALVGLGRIWWPVAETEAQTGPGAESAAGAGVAQAGPTVAGAQAGRIVASLALLMPFAASLVGWFTFFYVFWGTFSPAAPYGAQRETRLAYLPAGGPGLLFDQEYGVIAFAPALFLGLTGLVAMIAAGGHARRLAIEIVAIGGALLATVGAFHLWWGGSAPAGRPIISGLLLLAVPFAWRYQQQRGRPALRAAYHLLIVAGLAFGLTLALAQGGLLLAANRNGTSRLLEWLSPTWTLWTIAPSFITQPLWAAVGTTVLWIGAALIAGWWLARRPQTLTSGQATLTAFAACTVAIVALSAIVPLLTRVMTAGAAGTTVTRTDEAGPNAAAANATAASTTGAIGTGPDARRSGADTPADLLLTRLQARGRSPLLDSFDATRRPLAILFNPLRPIDPASLPSLIEFVATERDRRPRPPIPLLYNARWSLPAGRYTVELIAERAADVTGTEPRATSATGSLEARADGSSPAGGSRAGGSSPGGGGSSPGGGGSSPGGGSAAGVGSARDTRGTTGHLATDDVVSGDVVGSLSLMLGYSGRAAREWEVSMGRPGAWGRTFDLLTDMNLVGFRTSPEIERAAPVLRIRPETIIDVHARLPPAELSSAAMLGDTTVYFHDPRLRAEGDGFWTPATSTVMLTVAAPRTQTAVLALRAGPVPTAVGLATQGWRERVTLEPGGEKRLPLPASRSGVLRLIIETSTGFVPADLDPASQDRRALGAWIAFEGSASASAAGSSRLKR